MRGLLFSLIVYILFLDFCFELEPSVYKIYNFLRKNFQSRNENLNAGRLQLHYRLLLDFIVRNIRSSVCFDEEQGLRDICVTFESLFRLILHFFFSVIDYID